MHGVCPFIGPRGRAGDIPAGYLQPGVESEALRVAQVYLSSCDHTVSNNSKEMS